MTTHFSRTALIAGGSPALQSGVASLFSAFHFPLKSSVFSHPSSVIRHPSWVLSRPQSVISSKYFRQRFGADVCAAENYHDIFAAILFGCF